MTRLCKHAHGDTSGSAYEIESTNMHILVLYNPFLFLSAFALIVYSILCSVSHDSTSFQAHDGILFSQNIILPAETILCEIVSHLITSHSTLFSKMPSKIQLDENLWFLYICLQKSDMKSVCRTHSISPPPCHD
jgi:hypothetical protein